MASALIYECTENCVSYMYVLCMCVCVYVCMSVRVHVRARVCVRTYVLLFSQK